MLSTQPIPVIDPRRRFVRAIVAAPAVWRLAVGWFLFVPLLYLSTNGVLIPRTSDISYAATGESPSSPMSHKISVALVCLICMIVISINFSQVLAVGRRMKFLLAFPLLAILSSAWSDDTKQTVVSGSILLIFTLFAMYVGSRFSFQRQFELMMLMGAIALPASILAALLVPSIGCDGNNWRGIFGHKQNCAAVSVFWLLTALHWKPSGLHQRMFRAAYVCMCLLLIVMSKSRTGWFLAVIALGLATAIWLLQKMPAIQAITLVLIGLVGVAVAIYGIHAYSLKIIDSVGKDSTLSERTTIWAATWIAIQHHPMLGYGWAAFWKGLYGPSQGVVLAAGWGLTQAQDGFLDVWLGIGAVGVALIALMTLQALRNTLRCFYSQTNAAYVRWCIVVVLCTLLYNIGESTIGRLQMVWFLFLLACIGLDQGALRTRTLWTRN